MKKVLVGLFVACMAFSARADISVDWSGTIGFYNWNATAVGSPGGASIIDDDYINFGGGSAIAYLIYSSDNIINLDTSNLGGALVSGNDQVLDFFNINNAPYGDFNNGPEQYAGALSGGGAMVFLRILDLTAPDGAIAQYFDGPTITTLAYDPQNPLSQALNANTPAGVTSQLGDQMIAIVPEPSVLAFLAIGGLALAIRRRVQA